MLGFQVSLNSSGSIVAAGSIINNGFLSPGGEAVVYE